MFDETKYNQKEVVDFTLFKITFKFLHCKADAFKSVKLETRSISVL